MSRSVTAPLTADQARRTAALDTLCRCHLADLDLLVLEARQEDAALPIRQKDRHALVSRAREKLRLIEAKLKEIEA